MQDRSVGKVRVQVSHSYIFRPIIKDIAGNKAKFVMIFDAVGISARLMIIECGEDLWGWKNLSSGSYTQKLTRLEEAAHLFGQAGATSSYISLRLL
jgi:hypothetical protein